jgi:DNA-directed RNA polymerase subunit E'/Rpb7
MSKTMADPLFERREIVRVMSVPAKYVQRNIRGSLLAQLSSHVEGKCGIEGYIQPKTSVILDHSLGKMDMLHTGVRYRVRFHADVCYPHKGQKFEAPVAFRSKIGVHAEMSPIRVLLPRDLHIGNTEFESIEAGDSIEFEVIGSEFKQNDESIFVLGKLLQKNRALVPVEAPVEELVAPLQPQSDGGDVKSVTVKEIPKTDEKVRRRKRLGVPSTLQLNVASEPAAEGEAKGGAGEALAM